MCVCMCVRMRVHLIAGKWYQDTNGHSTNGTQDHREESNHKQREKTCIYMSDYRQRKKVQKKVKKNLEIRKKVVTL